MVFLVVSIVLVITLPWHGDRIQQLVEPQILDQTHQISREESSWSFICEIIGFKPLAEKKSRLFQYLQSDVGSHNLSELLFDCLHRRVVQQPP